MRPGWEKNKKRNRTIPEQLGGSFGCRRFFLCHSLRKTISFSAKTQKVERIV